jgi:outer membrane protein
MFKKLSLYSVFIILIVTGKTTLSRENKNSINTFMTETNRDNIHPLLVNSAPFAVTKTITRQYPGAKIREVELETWQGQPAWEVELTTHEDENLEIYVSESGDILNVSKETSLFGGELALGFGTFYEKSPYKGVGYEVDPVPIIQYQYRNGLFQVATEDGVECSYTLFKSDRFSFGPLAAAMIGDGFEEDDSDHLTGMDEPDMITYHGGLFCNYEAPNWGIELKFYNELLNEHSGQEVELSLEREWEFGKFGIEPSISAKYQSSDWTDYYYGVSMNEVRPGRPKYDPGSAINFSAELMLQYDLSPNISLIGMLECENLDSSISRSPIIERDLIFELFFGIMYSF